MARLEYFVVAQGAAVDSSSNSLSLWNILDAVTPKQFPAAICTASAVTSLILAKDEAGKDMQLLLRVTRPLMPKPDEFTLNFTAESQFNRLIQRLTLVPLEAPGEILFEAILNGHHLASHTIFVGAADANAPESDAIIEMALPGSG
jgi:hypothetical protein